MGENKKGIKQWIEDHKLDVIWNDLVFMIDGSRFIEILPKDNRILIGTGDDLQVNYTDDELAALHSVDYMVFKFSENYYYTDSPIGVGEPLDDFKPLKYIGDAKKLIPLNFPYVGIHGAYELCNGSRLYSDWCNKAKFLGFNTIGICEKNTLAGTLEFQSACKKVDIRPIIGATYTVKRNDYLYNVKLYVKNQQGWQNLLRVNKVLNVDNADSEVPFIDEDSLLLKLEGIVCVFSSGTKLDTNIISKYKKQTNTVYYQFDTVKWKADDIDKAHLVELKRYLQNFKTILPPVLICDSYYLDSEDHHIKKKLNIIGKAGFEHQSDNQYFKNIDDYYSELSQLFGSEEEDINTLNELFSLLIENTQQLDKLCEFEIPLGELHLPEYELTEEESKKYKDNEDLFWALIGKGLADKNINSQEYIDRLEIEVAVIRKGGVLDYFLILWDIVEFARRSGILVGVGRGSSGGSLVSYLLGITKLDPIKYGLLFERFLNESRLEKSLPDIDIDFQASRRDEIVRYMENRYGKNHVTSIGTYTTMKTKAAIKDLARIRGISPQIMNYITATFNRSGTKWIHLFQDASDSAPFKKWMQSEVEGENHNFAYEIINDISLVLNQPKTASIHAAGVVITPKSYNGKPMTIFDWMPIRKSGEILVSEWEGPTIEKAGFLKEDILSLSQLDKFKSIFDFIGKEIDFEDPEIDYNDPDVMEYFKKGYNQDVFQIGTSGLSQYCQKLQPEGILDLIATISLFRPGAMGSGSHITYIHIKNGKSEPVYGHELLQPVTESTYGLYIYQEQVMKAVQVLGGFTLAEADDVRKAMGKKDLLKMAEMEPKFIQGALLKGCGRDVAQNIWNELKEFASYGFNLSHAAAYAIMGYFCQWLKYKYSMGYWFTSLQAANDKQIPIRINEINKLKKEGSLSFTIAPPDINESEEKIKAVGNIVYWGLGKISFAGEAVLEAIKTERSKSRFFSFEEFYERINRSVVNKRVMLNLILAGCFDSLANVGDNYVKRLDLVKELHGITRGEAPEILHSDKIYEKWFFPVLQREISGMSEIDYSSVIDESNIRDAKMKYMSGEEISNKQYDSKWDDKNTSRPSKKIIATGILDKILIRKSVHGDFAQLILDENGWLFEVTVWAEEWIEQQEALSKQVGRIIVLSGSVSPDYFSRKWTIKFLSDSSLECL